MTRRNKSWLAVMVVCTVLILSVAMTAMAAQEENHPVVKINDRVMRESDLNEMLNKLVPFASFHGGLSPEKREKYRGEAMDMVIEKELMYQAALALGLVVDKKKLEYLKDATIDRMGGKKNFREALKRESYTESEYEDKLRKDLMVDMVTEQEINGKAVVNDEDIRDHYEKNKKTYFQPESRHLFHIFIQVSATATDEERAERKKRGLTLIDKLRSGEDFGKLAWDYSDDPFRVKGGDLGLIHRGRLDPSLEASAYALKPGEVSALLQSDYGYHIFRLAEILPPVQIPLEEVSNTIRTMLRDEKLKTLKAALIKSVKDNARIEVIEK